MPSEGIDDWSSDDNDAVPARAVPRQTSDRAALPVHRPTTSPTVRHTTVRSNGPLSTTLDLVSLSSRSSVASQSSSIDPASCHPSKPTFLDKTRAVRHKRRRSVHQRRVFDNDTDDESSDDEIGLVQQVTRPSTVRRQVLVSGSSSATSRDHSVESTSPDLSPLARPSRVRPSPNAARSPPVHVTPPLPRRRHSQPISVPSNSSPSPPSSSPVTPSKRRRDRSSSGSEFEDVPEGEPLRFKRRTEAEVSENRQREELSPIHGMSPDQRSIWLKQQRRVDPRVTRELYRVFKGRGRYADSVHGINGSVFLSLGFDLASSRLSADLPCVFDLAQSHRAHLERRIQDGSRGQRRLCVPCVPSEMGLLRIAVSSPNILPFLRLTRLF